MAERAAFSSLWEEAKSQYKLATDEDLDSPSFPRPDTADDLLILLDKENARFKAFREKRSQILQIISAICRPVEAISVVGGGLSAAFPAAAAFGAVKYLITAANGVSESYDAIVNLFSTLKVCVCAGP